MSIRSDPMSLGCAAVEPTTPFVAGGFGTWRLTYRVGAYGYDESARLKIAWRFASDMQLPQFDRPGEAAYTTLQVASKNPTAKCRLYFEHRGMPRPYTKCFVVEVSNGTLYPGDSIEIVYGDTRGGGPGARFQTFREKNFAWHFYADPFATEVYTLVEPLPRFDIVGGELHKLVAVAPTTVKPGEPFDALVKAEDRWGNPCERCSAAVRLSSEGGRLSGLPAEIRFESGTLAVARLKNLVLHEAGAEARLLAACGERSAESNPIHALEDGALRGWWGDLHGQTGATVGTGTVKDYYTFARDVALTDVCCHQGNDFQVTNAEWQHLLDQTRRFHQDGRFVVFPGYEWSGMTPGGGDRNVIYKTEKDAVIYRSSYAEIEDRGDLAPDCFPVTELYARLRGRHDAILIPHIGGRYANIVDYVDHALEPLIEVYSDWGRFEWLIADAFRVGRKPGFVAQSDGHKGRPGASHPGAGKFGVYGGLACYLAGELSREAIFEAMKKRRCYGVSNGKRIYIALRIAGRIMGEEGPHAGPVPIKGRVVGSGPLARVDLMRNMECVKTLTPYAPEDFAKSNRFRVEWSGSSVRGRGRMTVWDGALELSDGAFRDVEPYAFVNPEKGIKAEGPQRISWVSVTTGGDNGADFTLDAPDGATLRFRTPVKDLDVRAGELREKGALCFPAGGVDLEVRFRKLPASGFSRVLPFEESLPAPEAPWRAYWIRVTQEDGTQAWTSPVYLNP